MNMDQMNHYQRKLAYEMDSADLYVALNENEPIVIVDGRSAEAYTEERIPSAINLPHKAICFNSVESLDSSKVYVCYCDGIGCNALDKDGFETADAGLSSARIDRRSRLVEARWLRHRRRQAATGDRDWMRMLSQCARD